MVKGHTNPVSLDIGPWAPCLPHVLLECRRLRANFRRPFPERHPCAGKTPDAEVGADYGIKLMAWVSGNWRSIWRYITVWKIPSGSFMRLPTTVTRRVTK